MLFLTLDWSSLSSCCSFALLSGQRCWGFCNTLYRTIWELQLRPLTGEAVLRLVFRLLDGHRRELLDLLWTQSQGEIDWLIDWLGFVCERPENSNTDKNGWKSLSYARGRGFLQEQTILLGQRIFQQMRIRWDHGLKYVFTAVCISPLNITSTSVCVCDGGTITIELHISRRWASTCGTVIRSRAVRKEEAGSHGKRKPWRSKVNSSQHLVRTNTSSVMAYVNE